MDAAALIIVVVVFILAAMWYRANAAVGARFRMPRPVGPLPSEHSPDDTDAAWGRQALQFTHGHAA